MPALGHEWDGDAVTTEPTCTEPGVRTFTCKHDKGHTRTEAIEALGHDWADVGTVAATAIEPAYRLYRCSRCGSERRVEMPVTVDPERITSVTLSKSSFAYNGKVQKPTVKSVKAGSKTLSAADYAVSYSNKSSKTAGTYRVTVTGKGDFAGSRTLTYKIAAAVQPLKATGKTVTLQASKLKSGGPADSRLKGRQGHRRQDLRHLQQGQGRQAQRELLGLQGGEDHGEEGHAEGHLQIEGQGHRGRQEGLLEVNGRDLHRYHPGEVGLTAA